MNWDKRRSRPAAPEDYGFSDENTDQMLTWAWVSGQMEASRNYWLSTARADGNPHLAPVWGVWHADALYFSTDAASVKGRNMARNPNIAVALESGDEVVIMYGHVRLLSKDFDLSEIMGLYGTKYEPDDDQKAKELAQGMLGLTYEFNPSKVLAWLEKDYPNTATRWIRD